jgi:hypothetical protein
MPIRNYSSTAEAKTLSTTINSSVTSMTVNSVSTLPSLYPYTLVIDPDTVYEEILTVTAAAGTSLTITRGQDGTSAQSHNAGAVIRHMITARDLQDAQNHIEASTGGYTITSDGQGNTTNDLHGILSGEGAVVGTLKSQTLTNKTLTSPTITSPTISGTITGAVVTSANIVNDTIVNADINTAAAIDTSKLNAATSTTLAFGTNASAITANGLTISATEIGYLDGVTANLAAGYRLIGVKTYTTVGTTAVTIATEFPSARALNVTCVGGGGGGGGAASTSASQAAIGGGGGGGGYSEKFLLVSSLSASENIKVGGGGTGGAAGNNNGVAGTASSFSVAGVDTVIGNGGGAGQGDAAGGFPFYGAGSGNGGTGTGGDLQVTGSKGPRGHSITAGSAMYPVTGGGSRLSPQGILEASASGTTGGTGGIYGQGGGGGVNTASQGTKAGGNGGQGIVIVEYYA